MHKILLLLVTTPIYLISLLPLRFHYFLSSLAGFFLFRVLKYRQNVVTVNIARSFPQFKYNDIKVISDKFYRNFTDIIAENIKMISLSTGKIKKMGKITNPELLMKFYRKGVPVIIAGGHMGNWEFLTRLDDFEGGDSKGYSGKQLCFVYKQQHSALSDSVIRWVRSRNNKGRLIESGSAARAILKNKDLPACYFLFSDQAPLPGSKFRMEFLSQQTFMINGPEVISKAAGIPVLFVEMQRDGRGRYLVTFHEIAEDPAQCEKGDVTAGFARLLETCIKREPDNWLWSHKRWKRGVVENELHKR
ncbi:MAG: lysophospholipid acyltransferase family protein [Bacteroidales bacterium]|nr:lysophospholipid acyltransferase family protein [Bacteroidales bacterium]MDD3844001.1 lysophospholipid acyltransferase family protein [Bacteroidales bacterium]